MSRSDRAATHRKPAVPTKSEQTGGIMEWMLSALTPQKYVKHLEVPLMNVLVFPLASLYVSVFSANTTSEVPV